MNRVSRFVRDYTQYIYEKIIQNWEYSKYVLMFHVVTNDKKDWYEDDYSISVDSFEHLIIKLQEKGYCFASPDDFFENNADKSILLSFDDAFESVYYNVYPFLRDRELPFIIFQTRNLLEKDGYMKEFMIREMIKYKGFTLGAHAQNHIKLSELNKKQSYLSISASKTELERIFHVKIQYMAYPYGSYSAVKYRDRMYAKKAGYSAAFSTVNKGIGSKINCKYFVPRINMNERNYKKIISH